MGPFLVTGAACFGGAVAIGMITAAAVGAMASTSQPLAVRGMFIVSVAFREGIGVLGVVIGILAVVIADMGGTSSSVVAAVPAVGGAVAGIVLALRGGPDPSGLRFLGIRFIGGLGVLGVVVAIEGIVIGRGATLAAGDGPFVIVAVVLVAVQLIAGQSAAGDIQEAGRSPSAGSSGIGTPGTLEYVRARLLRMAMLTQVVAIGAVIVAIYVLVTSVPRLG